MEGFEDSVEWKKELSLGRTKEPLKIDIEFCDEVEDEISYSVMVPLSKFRSGETYR